MTPSRPAPSYKQLRHKAKLRKTRRRQWGTTLPHSTKRPKKANAARKRKNWLRAYGSKERVTWVQQQACVVCGNGPCENVHVVGDGAGRKADASNVVPLCTVHHRALHQVGRASFERIYYGIRLSAWAAQTERRWQALWAAQGARE